MKIATAAKMVVIDASVASKWYLLEHDRSLARALLTSGDELIAPELIIAEVMNAIWKSVRSGHVAADQFAPVVNSMLASFVQLHELAPLALEATQIAIELDHPVYDCFYLALADREGVELITADDRLYRKTRRTRFSKIVRKLS